MAAKGRILSPVRLIIHPPLIAAEIIPVIFVSEICPE
jgi:hypothetical protein